MIHRYLFICCAAILLLLISLPVLQGNEESGLKFQIKADLVGYYPVRVIDSMEDEKVSNASEKKYVLNLWFLLENISNEHLAVPTKAEVSTIPACDRFFISTVISSAGGVYAKPPKSEIGLVEIEKGQFALVGEYTCKFDSLDDVPTVIYATFYSDEELAAFYQLWTGTIRAETRVVGGSKD